MTNNSRLNFSPVARFHPRFARPVERRLMLGLTARRTIQRELAAFPNPVTDLATSGLRRGATLLDRLQSTLTRYHD